MTRRNGGDRGVTQRGGILDVRLAHQSRYSHHVLQMRIMGEDVTYRPCRVCGRVRLPDDQVARHRGVCATCRR